MDGHCSDIETDELTLPFCVNIDDSDDNLERIAAGFPGSNSSGKRKLESDSSSSGSDSDDTGISISVENLQSLSVDESDGKLDETPTRQRKHSDLISNFVERNSLVHKDEDGDTLLHKLIIANRTKDVLMLLCTNNYADINKFIDLQNHLGQTPIHLAAHVKDPDMMEALLISGSDPAFQDNKGRTFLHILCENGSFEILAHLCANFEFEGFCIEYSDKLIKLVDVPRFDGLTTLHIATLGNHIDLVSLLLSIGASVNVKDRKSGRTSLHFAAEAGYGQLVQALLKFSKSIDLEAKTYNEETPLILAYHRGAIGIVKILEKKGAENDIAIIKKYGPVKSKTQRRSV